MRPAFNSISEHPLPLDPSNKVIEGPLEKVPGTGSKKPARASSQKSSGETPKTPVLPKDSASSGKREKKKTQSEVLARKFSAADK